MDLHPLPGLEGLQAGCRAEARGCTFIRAFSWLQDPVDTGHVSPERNYRVPVFGLITPCRMHVIGTNGCIGNSETCGVMEFTGGMTMLHRLLK